MYLRYRTPKRSTSSLSSRRVRKVRTATVAAPDSRGSRFAAAEFHRRALACDELHGRAHRELVRCLARAGDRTGALRHLDRFSDLVLEELDARPSEETLELRSRLERGESV